MKIKSNSSASPKGHFGGEQGSILVSTIVLCLVLGLTLSGYMLWASQHSNVMKRSQAWNQAIPVLEAGIEEALAHLYYFPTNRGMNRWKFDSATGLYSKQRNVGNDARFYVTIDSAEPPVIVSQGYVKAPLQSDNYISRTVLVTTTNRPLISWALAVKEDINMNGNGLLLDSFESTNPDYSDAQGHYVGYSDRSKRKDGANVSSNSGIKNSFNVGNASIYGKVASGSGGAIKIGPNGAIGSLAFVDDPNNGGQKQDNWHSQDANVSFPPIDFAPSSGSAPGGGITTNGVTYQYHLTGATTYEVSQLTGGAYVSADSTIIVNSRFSAGPSSKIVLAPGVTLQVFCYARDANFSGDSVVNPGTAINFQYWGMPSNRGLSLSGGVEFTGMIYAPHAKVTMGGGANNPVNFQGSVVAESFNMNGGINFHYDESLRNLRKAGYVITSWREI